MERSHILDMMGSLKLYGMRSAYDEIMTTAIKRQHEPPRVVGDLLSAEIAEKPRMESGRISTASIANFISRPSIFLPINSGVRPTMSPAINTASITNSSMP